MWFRKYGGWNKQKGCVEDCKRLDSFDLNKVLPKMKEHSLLEFKNDFSWKDGTKIGYVLDQTKIILEYAKKVADGDWEAVKETIYLLKVANNYGGERIYYECPNCCRRVRLLYCRWGRFRCRHCQEINYQSQQGDKMFSVPVQRMRSVLKKFNVDTKSLSPYDMGCYYPSKPKGMHKTTYEKHLIKFKQAQLDYLDKSETEMLRLLGRLK